MDLYEALQLAGSGILPAVVPPAPRWQRFAACADEGVDAFYPEQRDSKAVVEAARAVCARCPVQPQCLQYALDNDERAGVWGGTTVEQRRKLRRTAA